MNNGDVSIYCNGYHDHLRCYDGDFNECIRRTDQLCIIARIVRQNENPELTPGDEERGGEACHDVCNGQPRQEDIGSTPKLRSFPDRVCHECVSCCADQNHEDQDAEFDRHRCLGEHNLQLTSNFHFQRWLMTRVRHPETSIAGYNACLIDPLVSCLHFCSRIFSDFFPKVSESSTKQSDKKITTVLSNQYTNHTCTSGYTQKQLHNLSRFRYSLEFSISTIRCYSHGSLSTQVSMLIHHISTKRWLVSNNVRVAVKVVVLLATKTNDQLFCHVGPPTYGNLVTQLKILTPLNTGNNSWHSNACMFAK